ncbi:MAG: 16S rRNA processing protein RimM [Bacteroidaceae bacterium]|nr:16S rRNA processing protein RimM [Bacteroidaceae bacterium]
MFSPTSTYKIGTLTRTHGVRGEVAFQFTDDVWDRVEADYLFLQIDGLLVPFFLEEWRFRSDSVALLKFCDIDTADAAQQLVGSDIYFPKELTPDDLNEEDLTWKHFTGFEVWQAPEAGTTLLGTVTEVLDQTANVLLVVTAPDGRELLIPAHEDFILEADHRDRRLLVNVPPDLLTLNS